MIDLQLFGYPDAPADVWVNSRDNDSISIGWNDVTSEIGYTVRWSVKYSGVYETKGVNAGVNSHTITGLKGGTVYDIWVRAGYYEGWSDYTFVGSGYYTKPNKGYVTLISRTTTSITVNLICSDEFDYIYVTCSNGVTKSRTSTGQITFTGLSPGTEYSFTCWSEKGAHKSTDWTAADVINVTTESLVIPEAPTVVDTGTGGTSICVYVIDPTSSYDTMYFRLIKVSNGATISTKTSTFGGDEFCYFGLNGSTTYKVRCWSELNGISGLDHGVYNDVTFTTKTRPSNWSWGTALDAEPAIITQDGFHFAYMLPASTWNSFTARINQFLTYNDFPSHSFTQVSRGDNLTAAIFNQAQERIYAMIPGKSGTTKSSGDDLLKSDFNRLKDNLNSLP